LVLAAFALLGISYFSHLLGLNPFRRFTNSANTRSLKVPPKKLLLQAAKEAAVAVSLLRDLSRVVWNTLGLAGEAASCRAHVAILAKNRAPNATPAVLKNCVFSFLLIVLNFILCIFLNPFSNPLNYGYCYLNSLRLKSRHFPSESQLPIGFWSSTVSGNAVITTGRIFTEGLEKFLPSLIYARMRKEMADFFGV
jgi:hypothetical protein